MKSGDSRFVQAIDRFIDWILNLTLKISWFVAQIQNEKRQRSENETEIWSRWQIFSWKSFFQLRLFVCGISFIICHASIWVNFSLNFFDTQLVFHSCFLLKSIVWSVLVLDITSPIIDSQFTHKHIDELWSYNFQKLKFLFEVSYSLILSIDHCIRPHNTSIAFKICNISIQFSKSAKKIIKSIIKKWLTQKFSSLSSRCRISRQFYCGTCVQNITTSVRLDMYLYEWRKKVIYFHWI